MRRSMIIAIGVLAAAGGLSALTTTSSAAPPDQVTICHGTASESNPYVEITVSSTSFKDGHFDGVPNKSHGANNHPDFVLEEGRTCADGPPSGGTDGTSDGETTTSE